MPIAVVILNVGEVIQRMLKFEKDIYNYISLYAYIITIICVCVAYYNGDVSELLMVIG